MSGISRGRRLKEFCAVLAAGWLASCEPFPARAVENSVFPQAPPTAQALGVYSIMDIRYNVARRRGSRADSSGGIGSNAARRAYISMNIVPGGFGVHTASAYDNFTYQIDARPDRDGFDVGLIFRSTPPTATRFYLFIMDGRLYRYDSAVGYTLLGTGDTALPAIRASLHAQGGLQRRPTSSAGSMEANCSTSTTPRWPRAAWACVWPAVRQPLTISRLRPCPTARVRRVSDNFNGHPRRCGHARWLGRNGAAFLPDRERVAGQGATPTCRASSRCPTRTPLLWELGQLGHTWNVYNRTTSRDLLGTYGGAIPSQGYVLYDINSVEGLNAATSLCGPLRAVAVDKSLETIATSYGLHKVADVTTATAANFMSFFQQNKSRFSKDCLINWNQPEGLRDLQTMAGALGVWLTEGSVDRATVLNWANPDRPIAGWCRDEGTCTWQNSLCSKFWLALRGP